MNNNPSKSNILLRMKDAERKRGSSLGGHSFEGGTMVGVREEGGEMEG